MASKTKSGLFETPVHKPAPSTPRGGKSSRGSSFELDGDSHSPMHISRMSMDRASQCSVTSKPTAERRTPRVATPPEKPRILKPSELQAQLTAAQDDLKKAKEKLTLAEKEKNQALNELKEAKNQAEEANKKFHEALVAQKRAEETSEIEKFRAIELEQAGIEASQKKKEEWEKELQALKSQHALDMAALLTTTQELQSTQHELSMIIGAKNQALSHADDATKVAEVHAQKVEFLTAELARLKGLLELKAESEDAESGIVAELRSELGSVRQEVEKNKTLKQELLEKEKSHQETVMKLKSELAMLEEELQKARISEQDFVEKEKSHAGIVSKLELELGYLKQELEKEKGVEETLCEKDMSYKQHVMELESEIDSLKQQIERAKSNEEELFEQEKLNNKVINELKLELESLHQEVQDATGFQEKLARKEESCEELNVELEAARMAEFYALNLVDEWKQRAEELESKVAESSRLERSASESLDSAMKQLEGKCDMLHEAECEIVALKEKLSLLEISLVKRKEDCEESKTRLQKAAKMIESLKSELEFVKEEKSQAIENERLAVSSVQDLLEEKSKLINEMERLKEEEEKCKEAMESLASALHEVSSEAREAKEKLLSSEVEHEKLKSQIDHLQMLLETTSDKYERIIDDSKQEIGLLTSSMERSKIDYDTQMEDLKMVLKTSNDKFESMLDDAKQEIEHLTKMIEESKLKHQSSKAEWEAKEQELMNNIKRLEEENSDFKGLKRSEEEKSLMEKEITRLKNLLKEAEEAKSELGLLKEALEEAENERMKLRDSLKEKEIELQKMAKENEQLWATKSHQVAENGELSDSDKDYDLLPKVVAFSEENGHRAENDGTNAEDVIGDVPTIKNNRKVKDDNPECDSKMWESYKVDRDFSTEMETEHGSVDDEAETKTETGENMDQNTGVSSENSTNSDSKKKKKPLYRKFGNLLKKGIGNQK